MKDIKLFIATPMYGGQCTGFYAQSILQLNNALRDAGITSSFAFMFNESLIQRARNSLVQGFMKSDHTHLFFIDADIKFHAPDVIKMIKEDKEIICGIYPKKEINWDCVKRAIDNDVPTDQLKFHTGVPNVNLVGYQGGVTVARDQPFEIWNGATGFMMIKREVFEKLKKVVPSYTNDVTDLGGQIGKDIIHEYFACSIEKETNRLLSEDFHFCKVARENGIKVWGAPWAQLSHMGSYLFEGQLTATP